MPFRNAKKKVINFPNLESISVSELELGCKIRLLTLGALQCTGNVS